MSATRIYKGNSAIISLAIEENGEAKDCSGLSCVFIVKETNLFSEAPVMSESITWTTQSEGTGYFNISPGDTAVDAGMYYYEIVLYGDGYQKTINKGNLRIMESLGKE